SKPRVSSPLPGCSTFTTRAPSSARIIDANGHASTRERSRIVTWSSGFTRKISFRQLLEISHPAIGIPAPLQRRRERQAGHLVEESLGFRPCSRCHGGQLFRERHGLGKKLGIGHNPVHHAE